MSRNSAGSREVMNLHWCGQYTQNSGRRCQDMADAKADGLIGSSHCEFIGGTVVP